MSAKVAHDVAWVPRRRKDGSRGMRSDIEFRPFCPVAQCERCGHWGSVTWVRRWWARPVFSWYVKRPWGRRLFYSSDAEGVRCLACLNRIRPIWAQMRIVEENRLLIGRIQKEISVYARQDRNNRRAEKLLGRPAGESP